MLGNEVELSLAVTSLMLCCILTVYTIAIGHALVPLGR